MIGKGQSTVQHWAKTGIIPSRWHPDLLKLAEIKRIDLTPSDFVTRQEEVAFTTPEAKYTGTLELLDHDIPVYVLSDGRRVISRNAAITMLTAKDSGDMNSYLRAEGLQPHLPSNIPDLLIEFTLPESSQRVRGMGAETFMELCRAYVKAHASGELKTDRQKAIALVASLFLAACAKVGIIALIDEATGYQYERLEDALQFKMKLFVADEMRKWERTFPEELWKEFGRLTNWEGSIHKRPKYWGKLVMELIYEYLDPDVAKWLKTNAPKPQHGQNYHLWLTSQYGLKKLVEHIWLVIGMASTCDDMDQLRERMAEKFGRQRVQLNLFLPAPTESKS